MPEFSATLLVVVPLVLLAYFALYLLRLGMIAGELTEAARQRLVGFGMTLLWLAVLACLVVLGVGVDCLAHVFKF